MFYKKIFMGLLINLALISTANTQSYERSKKYSQTFPLEKETEVNISNKYGHIHIHTWEKDSIRFDVDVRVSSSRQARLDRTFNEIDVRFTSNDKYVVANTTFASSSTIWTELSDLGRTLVNTGGTTEINYTVWMPSNNSLKIDNRFGNIFMTDHDGPLDLRLSNGDLQAYELNGESILRLEFGNAGIRHAENALIDLNYASLDLTYAEDLNLSGRSSNINIQQVNHLQINSRRDKIFVNQATSVTGECAFSRSNFNSVKEKIMLNGNYGTIQVSDISNDFQYMQLNTSYTVVQLYLHTDIPTNIEVNYSKKTKLIMPAEMNVVENIEIEAGGEAGILKGNFGKIQGSSLKFTMIGGEISIFSRP